MLSHPIAACTHRAFLRPGLVSDDMAVKVLLLVVSNRLPATTSDPVTGR